MSHVCQQIIDAIVATVTGLATTDDNVLQARPDDLEIPVDLLPALLVYADEESADALRPGTAWPQVLQRVLEVRIVGEAADPDIETTLSAMLKEVETALNASQSAATCSGLVPEGVRITGISRERTSRAERTVGRITMTWRAAYYTSADHPEVAL